MICGSCKTQGVTKTHVSDCYAAKYTQAAKLLEPVAAPVEAVTVPVQPQLTSSDYVPMALTLPQVPEAKYAIEVDGVVRYYRVTKGTKNPNIRFVDQLIGAPGDWRKVKLAWPQQKDVLARIQADAYTDIRNGGEDTDGEPVEVHLTGPQAAAVRYSRTFTRCACCESPLSDPVSKAQGIGPVCITRFAA